MQLDALMWMFLPLIVAAGSALLAFFIMQARMEVAVAKERETLAAAQATIQSQKVTMEERVKATEEATRRQTMDQLMQDFRVEERSYVRESNSAEESKKTMVMQERMFFRNIPLSDWMEHEMVVEETRGGSRMGIKSAMSQAALNEASSFPQAGLNPALNPAMMQSPHIPVETRAMFNAAPTPAPVRESLGVSKSPAATPEVSNESLAALNRALTAAGRPVNAPGLVMSSLVVSEAALAALDGSGGRAENGRGGQQHQSGYGRPRVQAEERSAETAVAVRENRVLVAAFGAQ